MGRRLLATVAVSTALAGLLATPPAGAERPSEHRIQALALTSSHDEVSADLLAQLAQALGLGPDQELIVKDVIPGEHGARHLRLERTYQGLPVIAGDLVVHLSSSHGDERIIGVDWASKADVTALPSTVPSLTPTTARTRAERGTGLRAAPAPSRLVVYAMGATAHLAYETHTRGRALGPRQMVAYTDAMTGRQLAKWSTVPLADGVGKSLYNGKVALSTKQVSGRYQLTDKSRGGQRVLDAANMPSDKPPSGKPFRDADNIWGDHTVADRQTVAVDAAYGSAVTWDFFKKRFDRFGIRDDGVGARSFVHYGRSLDNAYWIDDCFCMVYGDGGTTYGPLVSLDVTGHEMAHGVTAATAGLVYVGEAGALNEATSDIFGTAVEYFAQNAKDPGDYLIGERITKARSYLRRLDHPSLDGDSADCYYNGIGAGEVHAGSGPANHFFYLLSEGSGLRSLGGVAYDSPTCDAASVKGIGRDAAVKIWYAALTRYFTSTTGYREARDATIRAARDLYGTDSTACTRVVDAWDAVGVPAGLVACSGSPTNLAGNAIANGGFESGMSSSWIASSGVITQEPQFFGAHSGLWYADFGGRGQAHSDTLSQSFTVPSSGTPMLNFSLAVFSLDGTQTRHDTFTVQVTKAGVTHTLATYDNLDSAWTYVPRKLSLAGYAGSRVTLTFTGVEDDSMLTAFLLDDVAVRRPTS